MQGLHYLGSTQSACMVWPTAGGPLPEGLPHLPGLLRSDITRLWQTSQQRGNASGAAAAAAIGPMYSQWDDFPAVPGEVPPTNPLPTRIQLLWHIISSSKTLSSALAA